MKLLIWKIQCTVIISFLETNVTTIFLPLTDAHYFVRGYNDKTNFTILLANTDITHDIIEVGGVYNNFILTLTYSDVDISRDFINTVDINQSFELLETNLMQSEVIKGKHIAISGLRNSLHQGR